MKVGWGGTDGRPRVRGHAILPAFEARGYRFRYADRIVVQGPEGRDPLNLAGILAVPGAEQLLAGFAAGRPIPCEWPDHRGPMADAWTVVVGRTFVCEACAS
jgi:hypothetical protein